MIDPKELRIGNTVRWEIPNRNAKTITVDSIGGDVDFDAMHAIPLTPEILEKCGFMKHPDSSQWVKNSFNLGHIDNYFVLLHETGYRLYKHNITSLHQLQNLYFALTGEELTYTP